MELPNHWPRRLITTTDAEMNQSSGTAPQPHHLGRGRSTRSGSETMMIVRRFSSLLTLRHGTPLLLCRRSHLHDELLADRVFKTDADMPSLHATLDLDYHGVGVGVGPGELKPGKSPHADRATTRRLVEGPAGARRPHPARRLPRHPDTERLPGLLLDGPLGLCPRPFSS